MRRAQRRAVSTSSKHQRFRQWHSSAIYTWLAPLALFGGRSYFEVPNLYRDASPIFALSKKTAPTCIVQGTADTVVPVY